MFGTRKIHLTGIDNTSRAVQLLSNISIVLKDLKMCLEGICKIESFTTDELLTIYNYTSSS